MTRGPPFTFVGEDAAAETPTLHRLVIAGYVALVILWSLGIRYNDAPDEQTHLFLVEYIYRFLSVPRPGIDPSTPFTGILSGDQFDSTTFWYFGLPFIHSLGAAMSAKVFAPLFAPGHGYLAARAFNWLMAYIFIRALLNIARVPGWSAASTTPIAAAIASIPQVTFIFAYFNADAFALAMCAMAVSSFLDFQRRRTWVSAGIFGIACGLILCSKPYYFPALIYFFLLLTVLTRIAPRSSDRLHLLLIISGTAAIALPVLGTTYALFGEFTGLKGQAAFVALHRPDPAFGYGTCYLFCGERVVDVREIFWWCKDVFKSFFMFTGVMDATLPLFYYLYFAILCLALAIWSIKVTWKQLRPLTRSGRRAAWDLAIISLFWAMLADTVTLNLIGQQRLLPQPQGRYIFVVVPFAALLISTLRQSSARGWPLTSGVHALKGDRSGIHRRFLPAVVISMLAINIYALHLTVAATGGQYPAIGRSLLHP